MKIFNIVIKDLKIVTRNWTYFAVLFIFPFFLILTSAVLLNSNSLKNVRVGFFNEGDNLRSLDNLGNIRNYGSLGSCLFDLTNYRISVCIHARNVENEQQIDVYVDNTKRIIELYTKQAILEEIFQEQTNLLEETSGDIDSQLSIYSTSIEEAQMELVRAEKELDDLEIKLMGYKSNLTIARNNFNQVYFEVKSMEPQIQSTKSTILSSQISQDQSISEIRLDLNNIRTDLQVIKEFLPGELSGGALDFVNLNLDASLSSLNKIDSALSSLEQSYPDAEVLDLLNLIENLITRLDEVKNFLDALNEDLESAIQDTRNSRKRVEQFQEKLYNAQNDLSRFKNNNEDKPITLNFKKAFPVISSDLVLISFPFVVSIIITFSSLVLSNKFILNSVNKPSHLREMITPSKDVSFVISDYLVNLLFISVQVVVLILIGVFWLQISPSSIPLFLISVMIASSIFIFLGISLGYLIKSESLSVLITMFLLMFFLIFSDILVPSTLSGAFVRYMINLSPFVILNNLLRDLIIVGKQGSQLILPLFRLSVIFVSTFFIAYLSRKASKDNIVR